MNKKRLFIVAGAALVILLTGLAGATFVFAQEPTPPVPFGRHGGSRGVGGFGGRGMRGFAWTDAGPWTMFDTAAEALGLTPEELFAELREGKNPAEIAEEQGIELEAVYEAVSAAQGETMEQAIKQAVEDGSMSQERANWMLEGLERGFFPRGQGLGYRGGSEGECPCGSH